jgi:hypothetical protein
MADKSSRTRRPAAIDSPTAKSSQTRRPAAIDSPTAGAVGRRMIRADLLGNHTHKTLDGIGVHVYTRDSKYLARGRYQDSLPRTHLSGPADLTRSCPAESPRTRWGFDRSGRLWTPFALTRYGHVGDGFNKRKSIRCQDLEAGELVTNARSSPIASGPGSRHDTLTTAAGVA